MLSEMNKKYKYNKEYNQKNIVQINLKFNKITDSDIINFLDTLDNKQKFFKEIIKNELTKKDI